MSGRLPPEPTRFVGRARDLDRIEALLGEGRLVTLCGPPGIGKTRTGLQMARRLEGWFCDLSEAHDLAGLCAAVARGLDVTLGDDAIGELGRRMAALGDACIVLDNFEQLTAHAPASIGRWLETAPAVRFLCASRERLRLREETVMELLPLGLPRDGDSGEALELLLERARAHRPGFEPAPAELPLCGAVVRALEGIPLAIELAAARLAALGVSGLLERLGRPLEVLDRGARGAPERQATLRGAIEWSWELLDDEQRRALAHAAVFRGGFTVEAAEAVMGQGALGLAEDLRDRSLLWSPAPGRFAMYESIREHAAEKLAELGLRAEAEARHRDHYLALGERVLEAFERTGASVESLVAERDNLLAVYARAAEAGAWQEAARAVLALGPVLLTRGPARFHLELLERVMAEVEDEPRLHHARGVVLRALGDLEQAEDDLQRALELAPSGALYVAARKDLGYVYHQRRQLEPAKACYEAALAAARAAGDRRGEAIVVGNLGALAHDVGNFEEAARHYDEALGLFRRVGDLRGEGLFLTNLAVLEQEEGREIEARRHYGKALELLEQAGDRRYEAIALGNLGVLEHEAGDLWLWHERGTRARLVLLREVGDIYSEALCRARLGAVLAGLGELDAADRRFDEAERVVAGRDRLALEIVRLHRCFLDMARREDAAAFKRIQAAQTEREGPSLSEVNDDARMVLRMLSRSLRTAARPRLEIGPDAAWFRAPGSTRRPLDKHASARRVLARLARAHAEEPGRALSADELFEAGWPGVAIRSDSAHNRLYVTLAKLRKMGLKLALLRTDAGYLLDPATPVARPGD